MIRETAAAAIGVYEDTHPKRLGEEQGDGCLARKGPRCSGRGEAVGDCVFTVESFRRWLQIAYWQYGVRELQPPRSATPARSDGEN